MSMEIIAVAYYRQGRGSCAKSVAAAWGEALGGNGDPTREFEGCGGGKAPGGTCGALYAAMRLAGPSDSEAVRKRFAEGAGGMTRCSDIKGNKILPCLGCIGLAARILEDISKN